MRNPFKRNANNRTGGNNNLPNPDKEFVAIEQFGKLYQPIIDDGNRQLSERPNDIERTVFYKVLIGSLDDAEKIAFLRNERIPNELEEHSYSAEKALMKWEEVYKGIKTVRETISQVSPLGVEKNTKYRRLIDNMETALEDLGVDTDNKSRSK